MKAKIIEFVGIDGSGKNTAIDYVKSYLESQAQRVAVIAEAGNPFIPEMVQLKKLILNPKSEICDLAREAAWTLMALQNTDWINKNQHNFDFILSDRGYACKFAYGNAQVEQYGIIHELLELNRRQRHIASTFYFKIDPELAFKRAHNRGLPIDKIEQQGVEFQKKVNKFYNRYINLYGGFVFDASKSQYEVQNNLKNIIDAVFLNSIDISNCLS